MDMATNLVEIEGEISIQKHRTTLGVFETWQRDLNSHSKAARDPRSTETQESLISDKGGCTAKAALRVHSQHSSLNWYINIFERSDTNNNAPNMFTWDPLHSLSKGYTQNTFAPLLQSHAWSQKEADSHNDHHGPMSLLNSSKCQVCLSRIHKIHKCIHILDSKESFKTRGTLHE